MAGWKVAETDITIQIMVSGNIFQILQQSYFNFIQGYNVLMDKNYDEALR